VFSQIEIRSIPAKTEILLIFLQCASDFSRDFREHFLLLIEGGEAPASCRVSAFLSFGVSALELKPETRNAERGTSRSEAEQTAVQRAGRRGRAAGLLLRGPKILGSGLFAGERAMMLRPDPPVRFAGWNSSALIRHEGTGRRSPGMSRLTRAFGVPRRTAS